MVLPDMNSLVNQDRKREFSPAIDGKEAYVAETILPRPQPGTLVDTDVAVGKTVAEDVL
jgi:hypothetical protein